MQLVQKTRDKLPELLDERLERTLHFVYTGLEHTVAGWSLVNFSNVEGRGKLDSRLFLCLDMFLHDRFHALETPFTTFVEAQLVDGVHRSSDHRTELAIDPALL